MDVASGKTDVGVPTLLSSEDGDIDNGVENPFVILEFSVISDDGENPTSDTFE